MLRTIARLKSSSSSAGSSTSSSSSSSSSSISSAPFQRLVKGLQQLGKTCTVVESSCGGLIQSSLMAVPGSSQVYYGGTVAYNTKHAKKLLLNDATLHESLLSKNHSSSISGDAETYIRSKEHWTAQTAIAYCDQMNVDYAIAEGGATGPTFRPDDLETGFCVVAVAGRATANGKAELVAQTTVRSTHNDRAGNMRLFADAAATLAADTIGIAATSTSTINEEHEKQKQKQQPTTQYQPLDRATHLRGDKLALQEMEASDEARFIVIRDSKECLFTIITGESSVSSLALLSRSQLPKEVLLLLLSPSNHVSFLGLDPSTRAPLFAVDILSSSLMKKDDDDDSSSLEHPDSTKNDWTFDNIRTHAPLLQPYDYELVLYATALSNWKRTHTHCSACGHSLAPVQGGTCLQCTSPTCSTLSWPRQDPSIIVLVTNPSGTKALLARSPRHPPKVHTALAGFVEAGETFEQAVVREVFEETGAIVDYDSIEYVSSQPWPFPRSCMIGFVARTVATDDNDDTSLPELTIDPSELVSAGWFDRDQVGAAAQVPGAVMNPDVAAQALERYPSLDVLIPPQGVLARSLIDQWLHNKP
jgi:NAD+ diphosphatase